MTDNFCFIHVSEKQILYYFVWNALIPQKKISFESDKRFWRVLQFSFSAGWNKLKEKKTQERAKQAECEATQQSPVRAAEHPEH